MEEIILDDDNNIKDIIQIDDIIFKPKTLKDYSKKFSNNIYKFKELLLQSESFINVLKASIPEMSFETILSPEVKKKLLDGSLKIMTNKEGDLLANIVDSDTKKIISNIKLKEILKTPELNNAMHSLNIDLKLAQIAQKVESLNLSLNDVKEGLELDRLSTAYSTKQKLLQAMSISNPSLRENALLLVTHFAEDSRNLLMLSQRLNVNHLNSQPIDTIGKIFNRTTQDENDKIINAIKESMSAIYEVSIAETLAYKELGEIEAAKLSLNAYSNYIEKTFLAEDKNVLDRLFLIDSSNEENYWNNITTTVNEITKAIENFDNTNIFISSNEEEKNV